MSQFFRILTTQNRINKSLGNNIHQFALKRWNVWVFPKLKLIFGPQFFPTAFNALCCLSNCIFIVNDTVHTMTIEGREYREQSLTKYTVKKIGFIFNLDVWKVYLVSRQIFNSELVYIALTRKC